MGSYQVSNLLDVVQESLVLFGNVNNLLSKRRGEVVFDAVQPSLNKYAKGDFTEARSDLFGDNSRRDWLRSIIKSSESCFKRHKGVQEPSSSTQG